LGRTHTLNEMVIAVSKSEYKSPIAGSVIESLKRDSLITLDNVSVISGEKKLLDTVSIEIPLGQNTAILGPNGSGKSTFVKLISRHIHPWAGHGVRVFGQERLPVSELRRKLGIVSFSEQFNFGSNPPVEVYDCVLSGFFAGRGVWMHDDVSDDMRRRSDEALERIGVAHLREKVMTELSTGEARRVLIARALVHRPLALLLDEPCAGLDLASRSAFLQTLRGVAQQGVTLLLVTHHIEEVLPEINHVLMLRDGKVFCKGAKNELINSSRLSDLFSIPLQVLQKGDWYYAEVDHQQSHILLLPSEKVIN
jgi:iron complex transport system ATP-binding protein